MEVADRPRIPALAVLVPAVLAGALLVFGFAQLRPDRSPEPADTTRLIEHFVVMPGYEVLDDERSGAGPVPVEEAGAAMTGGGALDSSDLLAAGYVLGHDRAWGRPAGQPERAVLVFVSEYESAAGATQVLEALRAKASGPFAVAGGFGVFEKDERGRYAQRAVLADGNLLYVVSILTPDDDRDTAELRRLADLHRARPSPPTALHPARHPRT